MPTTLPTPSRPRTPHGAAVVYADLPSAGRRTPAFAGVVGHDTGTRLGRALLGYLLGITLVITLLPFRFAAPTGASALFYGNAPDFIANIALFLPLGFLFRLVRRGSAEPAWRAALYGMLLSAGIESTQLFEPERFASLVDVAANGAGAWLGALMHDRLAQRFRITARTIGRLGLELPLMGLVYLLVPLLWLDGLAAGTGGAHELRMFALGLFGASLLSSVQRNYLGPAHVLTPRAMAMGAAIWFLVGILPSAAARSPLALLGGVAVVAAFAYLRGRDREGIIPINRRFEIAALRGAAPLYAVYFAGLAGAAMFGGAAPWSAAVGFPGLTAGWERPEILRLLETVAASTLLGYMVAEFRGRRDEPFASAARWSLAWSAPAVLAIEVLQGFRPGFSASLAEAALLLAASVYGASIYALQRAHVRFLLSLEQPRPRG